MHRARGDYDFVSSFLSIDTNGGWIIFRLLQGREGKVVQVYRKKWVIHIERITREKVNGEWVCRPVPGGCGGVGGCLLMCSRLMQVAARSSTGGTARQQELGAGDSSLRTAATGSGAALGLPWGSAAGLQHKQAGVQGCMQHASSLAHQLACARSRIVQSIARAHSAQTDLCGWVKRSAAGRSHMQQGAWVLDRQQRPAAPGLPAAPCATSPACLMTLLAGWLVVLCAGATVNVGIDPSKVVITKLKMDKDRKALLERKQVGGRELLAGPWLQERG